MIETQTGQQHFTSGFFANFLSPKKIQTQALGREKLRMTFSYKKVLVEMDTRGQFHQHFMSSFYVCRSLKSLKILAT